MKYTKGETAGGWIHIMDDKKPIGLVHPKYVDKFLAAPDMYEALKVVLSTAVCNGDMSISYAIDGYVKTQIKQALAKAEGK